jgi:hypothetical protein
MFIRVIKATVSTIGIIDLFVCCLNQKINMSLNQIHISEKTTSPVAELLARNVAAQTIDQ